MKTVTITITEDGKVKIQWSGYQGEECFTEARKLYNLLRSMGVDVELERVEKTPEYYTTRTRGRVWIGRP